MCAVGVKKCAGNVHDLLASPHQNQTRAFRNHRYFHSLKVLFLGVLHELLYILRSHNHCHTLLRLGDCKLCSVQSCVFLRNLVQFYAKTVCQFSDCYGYTAGTKVVTFLNNMADFLSAEQSLQLTLGRSVTLLHLCATYGSGFGIVSLGRSGCTTDSVTSGASSKKNDLIARVRGQSLYRASWRSTHDRTDFHAFCNVIRVVNLFYISG